MNRTIQAKVNPRLLGKADRLFTGTLQGRIIEILQNARRAGATEVKITNRSGHVTVCDNGTGIEDFRELLDLGGSSWPSNESLEASEDPAGVGLFCLAPRKLTVRSNGLRAVIEGDGWTGAEVSLVTDPKPFRGRGRGTRLCFEDDPWEMAVVEPLAVFTGMSVMVDREPCAREPFIQGPSFHDRELGCRIQITTGSSLSNWHRHASRVGCVGQGNVLVNFHGQTTGFNYRPVSVTDVCYLVDLTGELTGIRLMLPARTQLVENDAFERLKQLLEFQTYLHVQQQERHRLPYEQYQRARELGIELPEAESVYHVGLLYEDMYGVSPVEVSKPQDFDLSRCYRLNRHSDGYESDEANAHLLAALGTFPEPFIPVDITPGFDGYSWARLPTIEKVKVEAGNVLHESWVWTGRLICVDGLRITAHTSDGKVFSSRVCMAAAPPDPRPRPRKGDTCAFHDDEVYVTPEAQQRLNDTEIWHHLGGFNDEGDSWDTQQYDFSRQLDAFWAKVAGPDEPLRLRLVEATGGLKDNWRSITIHADGIVTIRSRDGADKVISPPPPPPPPPEAPESKEGGV